MKTNHIILWAILSLTFSTLCYGQNQVRAYTLPLPLDPPKSRFEEFPSISIDSIVKTEAEDIVKEAMKDTKKNKKTGKQSKIINRTKEGITFVVDENLAPFDQKFPMENARVKGADAPWRIFSEEGMPDETQKIIAKSFGDDEWFYVVRGKDVFFQTMVRAYAEHRPLVLSPDMVWLLISQGFARYVNAHSEELRDQIVSHTEKMDLVIETKEELIHENPDWEKLIADFAAQIDEYTKDDIAKIITADFTTTGVTERITSQITLMETVKTYFDYIIHYIGCGIPNITLTGTPEDWQKVLEKTQQLEKYGMSDWIKSLTPILTEFVNASQGEPDQAFWQGMVKKERPDELVGNKVCDLRQPTVLDGWMLKLFPDENGQTLDQVPHTHEMPSERVYVDFRYQIIDPNNGNVILDTPMELVAGYIGTEVDTKTHALTPKMGWMVRQTEDDEKIVEKLKGMAEDSFDGIDLRVNRVPEHLSQLKHIKKLTLSFTGKVVLPEWMDKIQIDELRVKGKLSPDEMDALGKRFPRIIIQPTNQDVIQVVELPLIIVNGEPFKLPRPFDFENAREEDFAALIGVAPKDIKDITVLKDAAATAVWGTRGHNGVIEIRTKHNAMKTKGKKKISGTVSDAAGPLWGANVVEIDEWGQIVGATSTDSLGHFTLKVVNPKDRIRVTYIGLFSVELDMNRKKYDIIMESRATIKEEDTLKLRRLRGTVNVDEFEGIISADEFEGLEQTP